MAPPSKPFTFSNSPPATNLIDAVQVNADFDALYAALGLAAVGDDQLTSPTNPVWWPVNSANGVVNGITTASWYFITNGAMQSGGAGALTAQGAWVPPTASDVAVAGKTTRMRVRIPYFVNGVAPGINITWGLYPVTGFAGSGALALTLGTVVAGSTATATAPSAGGSQVTSAGFDFSVLTAGGPYILGVTGSGSQAANSVVMSQPILEMRHT